MIKSAQNHLDAIERGNVERGNVIGLRKLINASERKARRWSIGATATGPKSRERISNGAA